MAKPNQADGKRMVAVNKKARFRFEVLDEFEAGLALRGTEVKSLRQGLASLDEAFARVQGSEIYIVGLHIPEYSQGNRQNHEPTRKRKLLLHRREIRRLQTRATWRGLTLVPMDLYFNDRGLAKVTLAICRGRKVHDKREAIRKKDERRDARGH
jgi:SsrA-binding protein